MTGEGLWDSAACRFNIVIKTNDKKPRVIKCDTMFYALGWASLDIDQLQCTLGDCGSHQESLSQVRMWMADWGLNRDIRKKEHVPELRYRGWNIRRYP